MITEIILGGITLRTLYQCHILHGELFKLEKRLESLEKSGNTDSPAELLPAVEFPSATPAVSPAPPEQARAEEKVKSVPEPRLVQAVKGKSSVFSNATATLFGLMRSNPFTSAGVLLVLLGVGFLFALLAASSILPPAVRVASIALAGGAAFLYGVKEEKAHPTFALILQGGSMALEFVCAFWAYSGYELVGSTTAFVWMAGLSSASVGWAAYRKQGVFAFMGIAGSLLTPIIATTGSGAFSDLLFYSVWVSALGAGVSRLLGMPTLLSTTFVGVAALLASALTLPPGSESISRVGLLALLVGYVGPAVSWTSDRYSWALRQQGSIVTTLISAPLLTAGLLWATAGVSAGASAAVLGIVSAVLLTRLRQASRAWQSWLLPIAGGLGVIAMVVGLDGATRALAFSAGALGFVLIARSKEKRWVDVVAFAYWMISVIMVLREGADGSSAALAVSGLVALCAGFLTRRTPVALAYTVLAPLVLWHALWSDFHLSSVVHVFWLTAWAIGALFLGRKFAWNELRLSALWVPFGVLHFVQSIPSAAELVLRGLIFMTWLTVTAVTIKTLDDNSGLTRLKSNRRAIEGLSLAIPGLLSVEAWRVLSAFSAEPEICTAAVAAIWSAWCYATALPAVKFDFRPQAAGAIAAFALLVNTVYFPVSLLSEVIQWSCLAMLYRTARERNVGDRRLNVKVVLVLGAVLTASTVLRIIGLEYGVERGAASLVFMRAMQPWVSLLWAAAGVVTVVWASKSGSRDLWVAGGSALGVLVLKMLFVDLATFSLAAKVGVFIVTGLAFIALGRFSPSPPVPSKQEFSSEGT